MPKNNFFAIFLFFTLFVLALPESSYAHGIREIPSFSWHNVLYNQKGEEIGLEETNKPLFRQNVVLIYRAEGLENGSSVRVSVYDKDRDMISGFPKNSIIENGEIRTNIRLSSSKQKLENMETENDLQYFCILDLPDSKIVRSKKINANLTLILTIPISEDERINNPERLDFDFLLESTDGEYKQTHNVLKDGIIHSERGRQRFVYTDIILKKKYNLIQRAPDGYEIGVSVYDFNPLDFL
jgi:hypothetical protein